MISRLIQIRKENGYSQEKFAEKIGMSRSFINQVEMGKKNLSDRSISDICEIFKIDETWFRTGEGKKEQSMSRNEEISVFANKLMGELDESFRKRFVLALSKLNESDWETIEKIVDDLQPKLKEET